MAGRGIVLDDTLFKNDGYPIWHWLHTHFSLPTTLDGTALQSLKTDLDGFLVSLKTEFPGGCFCVMPECAGCLHSGQDVLLFVHLLSTYLRNFSPVLVVEPELTVKLISLSKECRVPPKQTTNLSMFKSSLYCRMCINFLLADNVGQHCETNRATIR
jgi:hypothetical protein